MHLTKDIGPIHLVLRDDLPPETIAMLQALYSRSAESVDRHLAKIDAGRLDAAREALSQHVNGHFDDDTAEACLAAAVGGGASARSTAFMSNFYVGYNHKSIGDCGDTTLFIENVSLLAAKAIQDNPLYCGQETSTRYIDMARRPICDPVGTAASDAILRRWMNFYVLAQEPVAAEVRARHPRRPGEDEAVYERAVKARTFDITRGFLPAGITTQLSWHTNLRQAGDKLGSLRYHPAAEMRSIAEGAHELLSTAYPSSTGSIGAARVSGVVASDDDARRAAWERFAATDTAYMPVHAGYGMTTTLNAVLLADDPMLRDRPRGCVIPHVLSDLGQITWRSLLDFGSFRDVQRQRNGVCRMPLLTTRYGFEGWYLDQLPADLRKTAEELLDKQEVAIDFATTNEVKRQYLIPLGYKVPVQLTYGLPATVYVLEIRSGKMVHPTLRHMIHRWVERFRETFPEVALHADMDPDDWSVRRGTQTITENAGIPVPGPSASKQEIQDYLDKLVVNLTPAKGASRG